MKVDWSRSKHFNPRTDPRMKCRCCGLLAPTHEIVMLINEIREEYGDAIEVNNLTRCTKHNSKVGGARNSYHIAMPVREVFSEACDIRPRNPGKMDELHKACLAVLDGDGGCIRYKTFIHCDVRPSKYRARKDR